MTYNEAVTLAEKLKGMSNKVISVELFGSVLKNGHGRDADFVVLASEALAKEWWTKERAAILVRWPNALYGKRWVVKKFPFIYSAATDRRRHQRLKTAAKILAIQLEKLAGADGKIPDFEIFILPPQWRTGRELNTQIMREITDLTKHTNTLYFLERIARDATKVA